MALILFSLAIASVNLLLFSPPGVNPGEFSNVQQRGMPPVMDGAAADRRGHAGRDRLGRGARAPAAGHPSVPNVAIFGFSRRLQGSAKRRADISGQSRGLLHQIVRFETYLPVGTNLEVHCR